ncbi:MAG: GGDEF domain-containing protein [Gammaproteobacteria bacterium]
MINSPETNYSMKSKLKNELAHLIYPNLLATIPLLIATSSMLVFKLHGHVNKTYLFLWLSVFFLVIAGQATLATWFNKTKDDLKWNHLYFKLLIADIAVIGLLWGIAGILFMPEDTIGQSYLLFILTFVAGGGLLYLQKSYLAVSIYVTGILIPLIGSAAFSFLSLEHHEIYFNLILGLGTYWSFLLAVGYYSSRSYKTNYTYSVINKSLTEDLSHATEELDNMEFVSRTEKEQQFLSPESAFLHVDSVTGVDTREVLEIRFKQSLAYARRHHQNLAVFCIKINNYEEVKATHKQDIANLLLKTVAVRLQYSKRETDILSRLDEDKFLLIVSEIILHEDLITVVNKILKIFAEKTIILDNKVQIHATIGISLYPKDGSELQNLINNSEIALSYLSETNESSNKQFAIYDSEKMSITNSLINPNLG